MTSSEPVSPVVGPTIEQALLDPELFAKHIAPYGTLLEPGDEAA